VLFSLSDDDEEEPVEACRATSSQTDLQYSTFSDSCSSWPPSPSNSSSHLLSDDDGYDVIVDDSDSDDDSDDVAFHDSFAKREVGGPA